MKKVFLITILLIQLVVVAQNDSTAHFRISSKISQYFFINFPFSLDIYTTPNLSFGMDVAFKPALRTTGQVLPLTVGDDYLMQNFWNAHYNSFTLGVHTKMFVRKLEGWYVEPNMYYRHWWFTDKDVEFNEYENYSYSGIRSERQNVIGINVLVGKSFDIFRLHGIRYFIDMDIGPGISYKQYTFTTRKGTVNGEYASQIIESGNLWKATINFGLSLGLEF